MLQHSYWHRMGWFSVCSLSVVGLLSLFINCSQKKNSASSSLPELGVSGILPNNHSFAGTDASIIPTVIQPNPSSFTHIYYVSATEGSDDNTGLSLATPFKTVSKSLEMAVSGDAIFVRAGIYNEVLIMDKNQVTLSAYPNELPIIDGGLQLPSYDWGALLTVTGDSNVVSGFEFLNCNLSGKFLGGYGIEVSGAHNLISRVRVHHIWEAGIIIKGDYNTVEDSYIWQSARSNSVNHPSSGWGTGMSAARNRSSSALKSGISSYALFRRNTVFNNWGEGLSCFEADYCTMEDNVVYDNWTVNLYLSDATNSVVQRNIVYNSSSPSISMRTTRSPGIYMADEVASVPRSANNQILNNFIFQAGLGAFTWSEPAVGTTGLQNVVIAYNTVIDGSFTVGAAGSSPTIVNSGSQVRNNIFHGVTNEVVSATGITFSNNYWASLTAPGSSMSDINQDPLFLRTGSTSPGALTSDYFKLANTSSMINNGVAISGITGDFFKNVRGLSSPNGPDIGGQEVQ